MNRRIILLSSIAAFLLALAGAAWWLTRPLPVLTVTTWPGAYERAQADAMLHPFGQAERVDVRVAEYDGGLDHLRHEIRTRAYDWDVVDLELADAVTACLQGLLEPFDASSLPRGANGAPASEDFVAGAVGPCWVGSVVFSQVIAYDPKRFAARAPKSAADFFDLRNFPGPRGMRQSPKFNLELALLADGVAPTRIYPLLSTAAGLKRALAKLSTIRGAIVWWSQPDEALALLHDGRAAMTTALNGSVAQAQFEGQTPGVIWDRQLYEFDVFAVPRGDPRKRLAESFILFATDTLPLARAADWVPYGPARRSSLGHVGPNPELGTAMEPFLPTATENFASAFPVNDLWWQMHEGAVDDAWHRWLNGKPQPGEPRSAH